MNILDFLREHFTHAFPILLAGCFALAIIVERFRSIFVSYPMQNADGFFERILQLITNGQTAEAVGLCDSFQSKPLARIVKAALVRAHLPDSMIQHGLEYAINENTQMIRKRTSYLATIANVATLLGLFGTIAGLIYSFEAVGHADPQQKSALLAAGIATAMNATMLGLGVAIPSMIAFSVLMNRSNRLIAELENGAVRTLEVIKQRYYGVGAHGAAGHGSSHGHGHAEEEPGKVVNLRRAS